MKGGRARERVNRKIPCVREIIVADNKYIRVKSMSGSAVHELI